MKNIIIGTAGHIDHGKTTLIKALTGRNTDRWEEEQRRGITIDLGFTYFDLPGGDRAGIIDVPGHEKFINNMVAGVVGMDLVLLVIAADEGIMPQTREHILLSRHHAHYISTCQHLARLQYYTITPCIKNIYPQFLIENLSCKDQYFYVRITNMSFTTQFNTDSS